MIKYLPILLLTGCTTLYDDLGQNNESHTSVLPAVVFCALSACDVVFSDRAERAGQSNSDNGQTRADQRAEATPTINIPLPGAGIGSLPEPTIPTIPTGGL